MKKYLLLLVLACATRFAFAQCDPPVLSITSDTICASDSSYICAPAGYTAYRWNNGDTGMCIYARSAGNYRVTVTDNNSCTAQSANTVIHVYPVPSVSILVQGDTLSSFGGVAYQWYYNEGPIPGAVASVYIIQYEGYYSLEITFENGCKARSTTVYMNAIQLKVDIDPVEATFCAGSNYVLNPEVRGGVLPYTYNWAVVNGAPLSCYTCKFPAFIMSGNSATSTYSVTVTDVLNITASSTATYILGQAQGAIPQFTVTGTGISCTNPVDTTEVTLGGPARPHHFYWGDQVSQESNTSVTTHTYTQARDYVIYLTADGCLNSAVHTVANNGINLSFANMVHPKCNGDTDGVVTVIATGGTPPYQYAWSNGSTSTTLTGQPAYTYRVTVEDSEGCTGTKAVNLYAQDHGFFTYMEATASNCDTNGAVSTEIYRGHAPFTYLWNTGDTTAELQHLSAGTYQVTVSDSLGCHTSGSAWVSGGCYSFITGTVFSDVNGNCLFDTADIPLEGISVSVTKNGRHYYGNTDTAGHYIIDVDDVGTYNLTAYNYSNGYCSSSSICGTSTVTINENGDTVVNNNIGFSSTGGYNLALFTSWTAANPGFPKTYRIYPYLYGALPTGNVTITFQFDSNLIYQSSNAPYPVLDAAAHTLTWTLTPAEVRQFMRALECTFLVPLDLGLNYLLKSNFIIDPMQGDCDSTNNHFYLEQITTGSYDPNEKTVSPANFYEGDSLLTYTIHFQNTGTDSTHFVILRDTLSSELNPATVRNIASSHPYSDFSISGSGILTWTFNPLRLVDSITDPEGSKGFVMFTVHKNSNRSVGTEIRNQAAIYFDYNEPVITNMVTSTIATRTGIAELTKDAAAWLQVFPNPGTSLINVQTSIVQPQWISILDVNGRKVAERKFTPQMDISNLSNGVYLVEVRSANASARVRLVKM